MDDRDEEETYALKCLHGLCTHGSERKLLHGCILIVKKEIVLASVYHIDHKRIEPTASIRSLPQRSIPPKSNQCLQDRILLREPIIPFKIIS